MILPAPLLVISVITAQIIFRTAVTENGEEGDEYQKGARDGYDVRMVDGELDAKEDDRDGHYGVADVTDNKSNLGEVYFRIISTSEDRGDQANNAACSAGNQQNRHHFNQHSKNQLS